jgi:hypothetical protein
MRKIIIFKLMLLININLIAQKKDSKYFIGVSYGKSFPLGDFKDNKIDLDAFGNNSGFAKTGKKIDIFGGYYLNKEYGITGLIRHQTYSTDATSFEQELNRINTTINYSADSKDWAFTSLLGGLFYNYPITKRISIQPKGMIGLMFGSSPEINVKATNSSNTRVVNIESGNSAGMAFEFGIGLKSQLSKRFALMPTFDFSGGLLSFSNRKSFYTNSSGIIYTYTKTYYPEILTFNFGLAVAYTF